MKRPWQGQVEKAPPETRPSYDPDCYLCPGNSRAGGASNPVYESTFVFTNDFAALLPETPSADSPGHPLFQNQSVQGTCRVICFSPRHDLTLPEMPIEDIGNVVDVWCQQSKELGEDYQWVQVFENKGSMMGCSNPHPHGQIWAGNWLPNEPHKEDQHQRAYLQQHDAVLLLDYVQEEAQRSERIVVENPSWLAIVPYCAVMLVRKSQGFDLQEIMISQ
jgi:UDPglucose--hexose-1-phosphate uridylyltransferase